MMTLQRTEVSVRGKRTVLRSFQIDGEVAIVRGRFLRTAEIFDEYWLEAHRLPAPEAALQRCGALTPKPDLFTFAQRVPDVRPRYDYFMEWDNIAAIPLSSYDGWLRQQVTSATRRNIKAAQNRGIEVRVADYDDAYVRGIMAIYNESPIRQGRRFWHYGKDVSDVRTENGTYADRSTFLAACHEGEMIGYLKIVWNGQTAAIMQVMSQMRYYDKRPNNALLAEAVKQCCARGVTYLLYERFVYGNKADSSLTDFKRNNGFIRVDVPRYYVPLTRKGALALRLGVHRNQKDRLPPWIRNRWPELRAKWYRLKARYVPAAAKGNG